MKLPVSFVLVLALLTVNGAVLAQGRGGLGRGGFGPPMGIGGLGLPHPGGPLDLGRPSSPPGLAVRDAIQTVRDVVGRPSDVRLVSQTVERDDHGQAIVRSEVLAISPSEASLAIARQLNFTVERQDQLDTLGVLTATLKAPAGMSAVDALAALRRADPSGVYDYNHLYNPSGAAGVSVVPQRLASADAAEDIRIGMIDGGIDEHHPAFRHSDLTTRNFADTDNAPATLHGTAVASLLAGHDGDFSGYLPEASLYAADVFGGAADGGSAWDIARALDWLASKGIAVTNISLAGPPNALLAAAVKAFIAGGHVLVAAAGNNGPAGPLSYPAAYPGVIGVTSVDSGKHYELDASRGAALFAAIGVDVRAAALPSGYAGMTGTSFAAPLVSARLALIMRAPSVEGEKSALGQLMQASSPVDPSPRAPLFVSAESSIDAPSADAR